jgi:beta-glucosidase
LNFPGENDQVLYGERLFVGYRAYGAYNRDVLFPFGYGLSYTQFELSNLEVSAKEFALGQALQVSLDVRNVGKVAGQEVVQLYVHDVESRLARPHKELKAFAKVALEPGESKRVTLMLDDRSFSYYDPAYSQWVVDAGEFDLLIGASSADIRLSQRVSLTEGTALPSILHMDSTFGDWLADARGAEVIAPFMEMASSLGDTSDVIGMDTLAFFKDVPLRVLISFQGGDMGVSPEQIVEGLLAQVYS